MLCVYLVTVKYGDPWNVPAFFLVYCDSYQELYRLCYLCYMEQFLLKKELTLKIKCSLIIIPRLVNIF